MLRQEDRKFEPSLGNLSDLARLCVKVKNKKGLGIRLIEKVQYCQQTNKHTHLLVVGEEVKS